MNDVSLMAIVARLNQSAGVLAVVGAAIDARLTDTPLHPRLAPHAQAVLRELGLSEVLERASAEDLEAIIRPVRAFAMLNVKLLDAAGRTPAWHHTESALLQALGGMTHGFAAGLKAQLASLLTGLQERLSSPDAMFLDVGSGVGKLSIEIANAFPGMRVLAIDPWEPAVRLARENIARAGLLDRIAVRQTGGQDLREVDGVDLAWIASVFMPPDVVPDVAARVLRALKPGGWALMALSKPHSDDSLADALWDFRIASFGGAVSTPAEGMALLRRLGYVETQEMPRAPGAVAALVAGRRPLK